MTLTLMADGIGADAQAIYDQFGPRMPVAAYINGPRSAWTPAEEAMFARKIRSGVEPGQPLQARFARSLDASIHDLGDAQPADVPPFVAAREAAGHHDATPYCDLSTLVEYLPKFLAAPRLWLAWYWNEGEPVTAAPLLAELARLGLDSAQLAAVRARLWAWQYVAEARWDLSAVFGTQDWSR